MFFLLVALAAMVGIRHPGRAQLPEAGDRWGGSKSVGMRKRPKRGPFPKAMDVFGSLTQKEDLTEVYYSFVLEVNQSIHPAHLDGALCVCQASGLSSDPSTERDAAAVPTSPEGGPGPHQR